jgi:hypothetical protein
MTKADIKIYENYKSCIDCCFFNEDYDRSYCEKDGKDIQDHTIVRADCPLSDVEVIEIKNNKISVKIESLGLEDGMLYGSDLEGVEKILIVKKGEGR